MRILFSILSCIFKTGNFTEDIKTESIASTSVSLHLNNESESDSDEDINFSANMIARHRRRQIKDPVKLIGANVNELYEDPADVANRNWGLLPTGSDPADQMFSQTPAPVVVHVFPFTLIVSSFEINRLILDKLLVI